jgi:hypothetical protein
VSRARAASKTKSNMEQWITQELERTELGDTRRGLLYKSSLNNQSLAN